MPDSHPELAHIRKNYAQGELLEAYLPNQPYALFDAWFADNLATQPIEPTAMSLATASVGAAPSVRTVLLKQYSAEDGWVFFTNYRSRKGNELMSNPQAALLFYWDKLERQVRIEGKVRMISAEQSDAYFYARPTDSQIGAIASAQSQPTDSRGTLDEQFEQLKRYYQQHPQQLLRPDYWGGFALMPHYFEFWQGRPNRLHDRICYTLTQPDHWQMQRLLP